MSTTESVPEVEELLREDGRVLYLIDNKEFPLIREEGLVVAQLSGPEDPIVQLLVTALGYLDPRKEGTYSNNRTGLWALKQYLNDEIKFFYSNSGFFSLCTMWPSPKTG